MTITLNADYDVTLNTALLGYVGETNTRPVSVEGLTVDGADRYVLTIDYGDGTVYEVAASMREYEGALLARPEFMRVHRSYIVNMLQAEKLSPAGVITFSGHNVPVSRLLYGQLQKDYLALLFSGRDA